MKNISPMQYDFLKEMGSIGVGNAATGLANLLGKRIEITTPDVQCLALEKVVAYLGGAEQMVCALLLKITGDISGSIMLVFPDDSSTRLLHLWFDAKDMDIPLNAFYESALKELSNIATGAYLTALSSLTGYNLFCSTPSLAIDMLGSLLNEILSETAEQDDCIVLIDTEFVIEEQAIKGFILLIMAPQSMEKIFAQLEVP